MNTKYNLEVLNELREEIIKIKAILDSPILKQHFERASHLMQDLEGTLEQELEIDEVNKA